MTDDVIRTELDADGVLLATIDMRDRTMNVFSVELMDSLDALMDRVDGDPAVRSCVVTSGKSTFLAGADLVMVRGYCDAARTLDHEAMFELCGRLGRQFVRLEENAKPWVAAVNGLALGGGLELTLACRERYVADDARLQLGVPEVRWGLLPGAGGTQRLPRLAPFEPAMQMLLTGQSIGPARALELGIVSGVVPPAEVVSAAKAAARALRGTGYDAARKYAHLAQAEVPPHDADTARAIALRHGVSAGDYAHFPAYGAIVDSVLLGAHLPLAAATAVEMEQFLRLMVDPVAGRMVRTLFLERLRAERELAPTTRLERVRLGPNGAARGAWTQALAKTKIVQEIDPAIPPDTLEWVDADGRAHRLALRVLDDSIDAETTLPQYAPRELGDPVDGETRLPHPALRVLGDPVDGQTTLPHLPQSVLGDPVDGETSLPHPPLRVPGDPVDGETTLPQAVLTPSGPYGRVVEIVGAAPRGADALAIALRALPWRTPGPNSLLQQLRDRPLEEQERIVRAALPTLGDPAFVDVAACLAGVSPAWSGGPLSWQS